MHRYSTTVVGIGLATLLISCSEQVPPPPAQVRPAKLMVINLQNTTQHNFPGEVKASKKAKLGFRVSGEILKLSINAGQKVTQGALLAELDPKEFEIALQSAQAYHDLAEIKYNRAQVMIKEHLIAQADYDEKKAEFQSSLAELKTAESNLSYTKLYAPYDGVIAATYWRAFEYVNAQQPVMAFLSDQAIDIEIAVPERLLSVITNVYAGKSKSTLRVSFPVQQSKSYQAQFRDISTVADHATGSYKVKLTMPQPTEVKLYSGMAADVVMSLPIAESNEGIIIPNSAQMTEDGKTFVWRIDENFLLAKKRVELAEDGKLISGLRDGDTIVLAGVNEMKQGQQVKKWHKERGL